VGMNYSLTIRGIPYIIIVDKMVREFSHQEGGFMGRYIILGLSLILVFGLVHSAFAAQRVVVCEEWYQET